jgi:transposase
VVPFEHTTGISVKGKNQGHKMANKDLKKLLHLCALAAIKYDTEMKAYYDRKKAEGKNGMLVLNAIRNKLVLRVVAVVNKQQFVLAEVLFLQSFCINLNNLTIF